MHLSTFPTLTLCIYFPVIDLIKDFKINIACKYSMKWNVLFWNNTASSHCFFILVSFAMYFKLFNKSILEIGLETLFIEAAFIYPQCVFALQLIIETLFGNFYELVAVLWPLYSIWYKWYEHLHKVIVFPFAQKIPIT